MSPVRTRSDIGRRTRKARLAYIRRNNETKEERWQRLEANKIRSSQARSRRRHQNRCEEEVEDTEETNNQTSADAKQIEVQKPVPQTIIKYEQPEPLEVTIEETITRNSDSDMSMLIMSEDESFKSELPEWNREEDKLILELLKQCLTPEEMRDKTFLEIIEDKNIVTMIGDSLSHKSIDEIRERVLYLLKILMQQH